MRSWQEIVCEYMQALSVFEQKHSLKTLKKSRIHDSTLRISDSNSGWNQTDLGVTVKPKKKQQQIGHTKTPRIKNENKTFTK